MATAAHVAAIEVSTDNSTYNEVDGIKNFTFGGQRAMLDTTDFKDTSGGHTRIPGLFDYPVSIDGDYEPGDTNGQVVLRDAFFNGTAVWIGILYNGSAGDKVQCYVESFEINAGVEDLVQFSCELVSTAARAAHS